MIQTLRRLLGKHRGRDARATHDIRLAVAALMAEVMRMDGRLDPAERAHILHALGQRFALSPQESKDLITRACQACEQALDLHQFTSVVIRHYSTEQRAEIISDLWRIAMADGHADAHEEQLIRRVSELIGISHRQFIAAKLAAEAG
ncbi:MAG: TerB family tellurite resistance protein [Zetaproteobacteria bacterium]|nr:MAG: TerB family tellurite resistance protein [Zetaproteobacteria bacterium]